MKQKNRRNEICGRRFVVVKKSGGLRFLSAVSLYATHHRPLFSQGRHQKVLFCTRCMVGKREYGEETPRSRDCQDVFRLFYRPFVCFFECEMLSSLKFFINYKL